jgi:hypothetical protein
MLVNGVLLAAGGGSAAGIDDSVSDDDDVRCVWLLCWLLVLMRSLNGGSMI